MKEGLFIIEGKKGILELLDSQLKLHTLYTTEDIFDAPGDLTFFVSEAELKKISNLNTPQTALAVFHIPKETTPEAKGFQVALDEIQDPGNLGTIIRMCDWFGIEQLICSRGTVDCYNPKVVQATMGSISRVQIHYVGLPEYLAAAGKEVAVYGAFLEGEEVYAQPLSSEGILVMGNEANGISPEVEKFITQKLVIPQFGSSHKTESLNVATATAIFLSEFRRRTLTGR